MLKDTLERILKFSVDSANKTQTFSSHVYLFRRKFVTSTSAFHRFELNVLSVHTLRVNVCFYSAFFNFKIFCCFILKDFDAIIYFLSHSNLLIVYFKFYWKVSWMLDYSYLLGKHGVWSIQIFLRMRLWLCNLSAWVVIFRGYLFILVLKNKKNCFCHSMWCWINQKMFHSEWTHFEQN